MNEAFGAVKRLFVVVPATLKGHFFDGPFAVNEQVNLFRAPTEQAAIAAYIASRNATVAEGYRDDLLVAEVRRDDFKEVSVKLPGILDDIYRMNIKHLPKEEK